MELKAAKEYVEDLMKKGKIRTSKSPYGAPLFFVKEKNKPLRGVVDYSRLNRITKRIMDRCQDLTRCSTC